MAWWSPPLHQAGSFYLHSPRTITASIARRRATARRGQRQDESRRLALSGWPRLSSHRTMRYLVFASLLHLNPLPSVERPYSAKRYQDSAHDADHEHPGVTGCIDDEAPTHSPRERQQESPPSADRRIQDAMSSSSARPRHRKQVKNAMSMSFARRWRSRRAGCDKAKAPNQVICKAPRAIARIGGSKCMAEPCITYRHCIFWSFPMARACRTRGLCIMCAQDSGPLHLPREEGRAPQATWTFRMRGLCIPRNPASTEIAFSAASE